MNIKRCIFHVPNYIDTKGNSGSSLRPQMMIQAFKDKGYDVEYVMGYGKERKKQIDRIVDRMKKGIKYDFLYSESSTMPTLLTEKNHIPRYPFLDFKFFRTCQQYGIKIGLFYRDIYWKFPIYKKSVSVGKRVLTIPMYKYDLYKYGKLLNKLYLPSHRMRKYVDIPVSSSELPPGCMVNEVILSKKREKWSRTREGISLFYVGGIGELYDLTKLLKVVSELEYTKLTICCREVEWKNMKAYYERYLNERIDVIHKSGEELEDYYSEADLCMLFFESEGYRSFAMPIKLFEYLGNLTPIIATTNTAAGEFVEKNNIGWSIPHDESALKSLLDEIYYNKIDLQAENIKMEKVLIKNTWEARAGTVINDLVM